VPKIPIISIVEDDPLVRDGIESLVRALGYKPRTFASAEDYLDSDCVWASSCLISDLQMPGMSGVELQDHLIATGNPTPIIFITAFFDEKTRTRVLEAGGVAFLKKPFDHDILAECLEEVLQFSNHKN
jgi:FixJ family two-component response regulator